MRLAILVLLAAVALTPAAAGRTDERIAIRPGVGIGPVNLGMTGQEVQRALGRPRAVITRRVFDGRPYVELEWNYGAWNVGLLGRKGQRRVVLVGTALGRHRTPEGLGVGTRESRLWRELRGRIRERDCSQQRMRPQWFLRGRNAETIFFPQAAHACPHTGCPTILYYYVGTVEVRSTPVIGCAV